MSKVETLAIRERMAAHLLNVDVDVDLGKKVAADLRLRQLPKPADAAKPTRRDLERSPALSILLNGPTSFAGRKVGALVTDGVEVELLGALKAALDAEGALLRLVAPQVGGVAASDGSWIAAHEKINGGPSVLFDAVVLLPSKADAALLVRESTVRDFVADAFVHLKVIAHTAAAEPPLAKAGVDERDEGIVPLAKPGDVDGFLAACRKGRVWQRAPYVKPSEGGRAVAATRPPFAGMLRRHAVVLDGDAVPALHPHLRERSVGMLQMRRAALRASGVATATSAGPRCARGRPTAGRGLDRGPSR